jgi:hypothetical protein
VTVDVETRAAELLESGWSEAEVRDWKRGYESVPTGDKISVPGVTPETPSYMLPDQFRRLPSGDRGTWYRTTPAGMLRAVTEQDPPDEQALEAKAAREWADRHEFTYGRRPSVTEARYAVQRRSDGPVLSGDVQEIASAFRAAGLRFAVVNMTEPLPAAAAITQPVTRG